MYYVLNIYNTVLLFYKNTLYTIMSVMPVDLQGQPRYTQ